MLLLQTLWKLLPRQLGGQCLLALGLGAIAALLLGERTQLLAPLGEVFLRASQVVVMPYLICELIGALGALRDRSLQVFLRSGALVLLGTLVAGALTVILLPAFLPPLTYSAFFSPEVLTTPPEADLVATYLPFNIFEALAADNFPAVVLFSAVMGIALQGMPQRQVLLQPLEQLRQLFGRLNRWVARITPYGIFGLTAVALARLRPEDLIRMQGLLLLHLLALVLLSLLLAGLLLSLTPLTLRELWGAVRGPLAITASSANLLIALPMLNENLRAVLQTRLAGQDAELLQVAGEEVSALLPIGFALPTLGKVVTLIFIPFAAWYVDRPMALPAVLQMLATGIPTVIGGLKAAARLELQRAGLPENLLQLIYLNSDWLYRVEKVLALEGLVLLAVLVVCRSTGLLRFRPERLLATLLVTLGTTLGLGLGSRSLLAHTLEGTYRNDRILLALSPRVRPPVPVRDRGAIATAAQVDALPVLPTSLAEIRRRGVLRVGVRSDGLPWAYRNRQGQLLGYDIDLLQTLARSLNLRLELVEAPLPLLEAMVQQGRLDLAVGGIQNSLARTARLRLSEGYQTVHLALVVPDDKVSLVQSLASRPLGRPLVVAVTDPSLLTPPLREQISRNLGPPGAPVPILFRPLAQRQDFFTPTGARRFDALLTTAEGGSAWAVLYPRTTMLPVFGDRLPTELVILIAGQDPALHDYLNAWITSQQAQGLFRSLFRHWVLAKP